MPLDYPFQNQIVINKRKRERRCEERVPGREPWVSIAQLCQPIQQSSVHNAKVFTLFVFKTKIIIGSLN
jgi:hypothetical protein